MKKIILKKKKKSKLIMHIIFLMEVNLCHIFQKMANVCLGNKPSINTNHNGMIISTRGHTEYSSVILQVFFL